MKVITRVAVLIFLFLFLVPEFGSIVTKSSSILVLFTFSSVIFIAILLGSSKSSIQDFESSSYPPPLACEAECQLTENSKGEDDHNLRDNEDFLPRLVLPLLLEYFHDDGDHGFHDGCDGYKEDNEGDDTGVCGGVDGDDDHVNKEEEEEEDFKRRIEEFIAKTNKIWREELLTDKLLCITTTAYE